MDHPEKRASVGGDPGQGSAIALATLVGAVAILGAPWVGGWRTAPLEWWATVALGVGALLGAGAAALPSRRQRIASLTPLPLLLLLCAAAEIGPIARVPEPVRGASAIAGMLLIGAAAVSRPRRGLALAVWFVALATLFDGAAIGWTVLGSGPPFSSSTTAMLLDISPRAFALESSGVDWMRHPSVYEPAGTDRIGPELRTGWSGSVAAYVVLVMGWGLSGLRFARSGPAGSSSA